MTPPAETVTPPPTILVVDDTADNLTIISALLRPQYRVLTASEGLTALALAGGDPRPDLILLDVVMPGLDGYEVCRRLHADPRLAQIPVIFLTARTDAAHEAHGFELGAVDYLGKPINAPVLRARVRTQLQLKQARDELARRNLHLEDEVQKRTREILATQEATILAMATLAETRDNDTGAHIQRTQATCASWPRPWPICPSSPPSWTRGRSS